jgi:hypothetical protein
VIAWQNAGKSGYDVSVRSRTTSVRPESTAHARWQRPACRTARSHGRRPRLIVEPQLVRVNGATGHQGIELVDGGVCDCSVHRERASRLKVVFAGLNLASLQGKQLNLPARAFDCRARSFEFDLLDPVGGQDGDLAALRLV